MCGKALPFREMFRLDSEQAEARWRAGCPRSIMDPRIVIVGFMGSGKTTVAKALAARLGCGLADLDAIVSAQQNMSAPQLINEQGESSFRDAETAALQVVLDRQAPRIIALGGGAWTLERNRDLINKHECITVWLDASYDL